MKILIVDDLPQAVELIRHTLTQVPGLVQAPEDIRSAGSVTEARVEILQRRPTLLILDEVLPGESIQDLLGSPEAKGIPVLLISAMAGRYEGGAETLGRLSKWGWKDVNLAAEQIQRFLDHHTSKKSS